MIATSQALRVASQNLPTEPPSERDLAIFAAVRVDCRRQVDVAAEFGISQSRVSQVIAQVTAWQMGRGLDESISRDDRKPFDHWLDSQRVQWLYEQAIEQYRRSCLPRKHTQSGSGARGDWSTESVAESTGDLRCLQFASRLLELRWELDERKPGASHALTRCDMSTILTRLISARHWAEVRGEVPRGKENAGNLAQRLLNELLHGTPKESCEPERRDAADAVAANEATDTANNMSRDSDSLSPMDGEQALVATSEEATDCAQAEGTDLPLAAVDVPLSRGTSNISPGHATTMRQATSHPRSVARIDPAVKQRAKAAVEYQMGLGLSDEQADRAAAEFARWRRLSEGMRSCEYSREQQAALAAWEALRRKERGGLDSSCGRRVATGASAS